MSVICLYQEWVVIRCVLAGCVVIDQRTLDFFEVFDLVLCKGARVNYFLQKRFSWSSVLFISRNLTENGYSILVTIVKSFLRLIGANKDHTEILILEISVDVKHVFFGTARHTDCGPVLAVCKLFDSPNVIVDYIDVCLK